MSQTFALGGFLLGASLFSLGSVIGMYRQDNSKFMKLLIVLMAFMFITLSILGAYILFGGKL